MLTLITGAPGTGKTAAVVSMLRELGKDRPLYVCNLNGLTIPHFPLADACAWHTDVPDGACIVIDEVQKFWRPRGPGQKPPEWIAGLETHRHRGLDFYIITQGANLVDSNVRALVGRHVHLRELGVLGRWWYEWPECCDQHRTAWKNAPIKRRYKLPKSIFKDYKSASIHIKPKRSFPWLLGVLAGLAVFGVWQAWQVYSSISGKLSPTAAASGAPASAATSTVSGATAAAAPSSAPAAGTAAPTFIDDRVAWIPRVSTRPESAPAYDAIRQVAVMPVVSGAVCKASGCVCVTQQGTDAGLTDRECRDWLAKPVFNPYTVTVQQPSAPAYPTQIEAPQQPGVVLITGAGARDPSGARAALSGGAP